MEKSILIAEDDDNTADLLVRYFTKEGFETLRASNGEDALHIAKINLPCLVILDLMMPGIHGWDVCEKLRTTSDIPILILSARQEEADRILGLNLGADDYVVKPFSPREVVARVHAILRRSELSYEASNNVFCHRELNLDATNHTVTVAGQDINLTTSEFVLLQTLMEHPGRVFSRSQLLDRLYTGRQAVIDRVVDVHIGSIRHKIESVSDRFQFITTVRGIGYRLSA